MIRLEAKPVSDLLSKLLGRPVRLSAITDLSPNPITYRGLVDDGNNLSVVIAGNEPFAIQTAAALAMLPLDVVTDGTFPSNELFDIYSEVANVLSRAVNEAVPNRFRLDPSINHSMAALQHVIDTGILVASWGLDIQGYGASKFGVWFFNQPKSN